MRIQVIVDAAILRPYDYTLHMNYKISANGLPSQHRVLLVVPCKTNSKVWRSLKAISAPQCTEISMDASIAFENFCVSVSYEEDRMIQIQVNVAGTMTDSTFEKVFKKNVAAAQPLPGFRRMKGGKTPEIPKEVALHLIGPSKVKREAIQKIINCTVAEYVQKEGLNASKNLKVQQSSEELEASFEPGKEFCFDAVIHLVS